EEAAAPFAEEYPSVLDYARDGREHLFTADETVTAPEEPLTEMPAEIAAAADIVVEVVPEEIEAKPKRRRASRKKPVEAASVEGVASAEAVAPTESGIVVEAEAVVEPPASTEADTAEMVPAAPVKRRRTRKPAADKIAAVPEIEPVPEIAVEPAPASAIDPAPAESDFAIATPPTPADDSAILEPAPDPEPNRPRKSGWWQRLVP
ncbi:MAG: hypothetical protein WCC64_07220, partial [Aliidongia sp.]